MIKNFWKHITFYCGNDHPSPIPMKIMEGETPFYACPHYMLKDENHPDGHEPGERACANRLSFTRAKGIVDRLMKTVENDENEGIFCDYTGMQFDDNGITAEILKYDPLDTRISIVNRRATQA